MKCLTCRNFGNTQCRECENDNEYTAKSETDIALEGLEMFNIKMKLPPYENYKNNTKLRARLLGDCIEEAYFRNRINKEVGK